jgi:hypothetical protein
MAPIYSFPRTTPLFGCRAVRQMTVILALLTCFCGATRGGERTAADILPASTAIFAEIREPMELLNSLYDRRLVERIEALDDVQTAMEKKEYLDFKAGIAIVESQMGLPWRKIVAQAAGRGIALAWDGRSKSVAIVISAADDTAQTKLMETIANLAKLDATSKGKSNPVDVEEYRGIKTYRFDTNVAAVVKTRLVIANKGELAKQIVDRVLDNTKESLAVDAQFNQAQPTKISRGAAWAYVNTAALRDAGVAKELLTGRADNPLAELLFGGILNTLKHTPYVVFSFEANQKKLCLCAAAPYDKDWAGEQREYYFGPQGAGHAPPRLLVDGTIVTSSAYRDISQMWLRADELFDKQTNDELAKADSGLTTLFAGKDFGQDILGALRPETQLVVARQTFAEGKPAPAIKLPAFGLVAELKDPAKMQPDLRRTFQSLIGFLNVVGAMNDQPQLELDMEKIDGAQFVTASYLPDAGAKDQNAPKINYNFSPSIAFSGSRFVVASTKAFAHTLATAKTAEREPQEGTSDLNSDVVLKFDTLKDVLSDNRGQLVAQNMLKEGRSKAEAEKRIDSLLAIVGWFDHLNVSLDATPQQLRLTLDIALQTSN